MANFRDRPAACIRLKRAYEAASAEDGERYLVDRLWPRGVKREDLHLTAWLKEAAPGPTLRRWFGHDPERWEEFRQLYQAELAIHPEVLAPLLEAIGRGPVTLVYAARDTTCNHALALRDILQNLIRKKSK